MHGQTCSRTRIIGRLDCSTNKAPDMHWESSLGPLVASQQRPGVLQEDTRLTYSVGRLTVEPRASRSHESKEVPRGCRVPRIKAACASQPT